jgi:glycosyltransferase involved in cell wall biosynthesis
MPIYREGFYKKILSNKKYSIQIFVQRNLPTPIKTVHHKFKKKVNLLKYFSFGNENIIFTYLPIIKLFKNFDIFVVEGNPRYISHFLLANLLAIFKKKLILWTMAHSSSNNKIREKLRLWWTRLFKFIYVYTDKEKIFLRKKGFNNNVIYAMNNGLDQENIDKIKNKLKNKSLNNKKNHKYFLSCARLLKKNKFDLAIKAFAEIKKKYNNFTWIVIGDGDQKRYLKNLVLKYKLGQQIKFVGPIYDENKLAPYFIKSECLIHPASIGLTLIHSFGYGLPVITHSKTKFHNPEIAAFKNNHTGLFFKMDDINSLSQSIKKFLDHKNLKLSFTKNCYKIVKNKYNATTMAKNFFKLVSKLN